MMGALQDTDHVNRFQNLLHYEVIEKAPEYCSVGQPYAVWVMTDKLAHAAHVESPYVYCSHILVQRYFRCNSPRQLGEVDRHPPRLLLGEQIGRLAPAGFFLDIEIAEPFPIVVANNEAGVVVLLDGRGRREAASCEVSHPAKFRVARNTRCKAFKRTV